MLLQEVLSPPAKAPLDLPNHALGGRPAPAQGQAPQSPGTTTTQNLFPPGTLATLAPGGLRLEPKNFFPVRPWRCLF